MGTTSDIGGGGRSGGGDGTRTGSFKYMAASVQTSLYRNGKVATRRNKDGTDAGWDGTDLEVRDMPVRDARRMVAAAQPTLFRNGFEVRPNTLATPDLDFLNHDQVVRNYYPQCTEIVKQASGARFVAAFDHNVRSAAGKKSKRRIEGGQEVQGPAHVVHGDYTCRTVHMNFIHYIHSLYLLRVFIGMLSVRLFYLFYLFECSLIL